MITLDDPELGVLEMRSNPYVVVDFQIGPRAPRVVKRNRALADGEIDDTRFGGARAVTVSLRLNEDACDDTPSTMQALYDRLLPYMALYRRPVLSWSIPGSGGVVRELVVRGDGAPVAIAGAKHQAVVCSFVASDGTITSPDLECTVIQPAADVELGRSYNLVPNRAYPTSSAIGDRLIMQNGNERADWTAVIFGDVTNPYLVINGVRVEWSSNGGLLIPPGSSLVIDTKAKTMYLNGDVANPRFDRSNYTDWSWPDVMLRPGQNTIRFGGAVLGLNASVNLCWKPTWAG